MCTEIDKFIQAGGRRFFADDGIGSPIDVDLARRFSPDTILYQQFWGWKNNQSQGIDVQRIRVDQGRWMGLEIGPESHAFEVELWKHGRPLNVSDAAADYNAPEDRIVVSARRPFYGVIEAPFEIWPHRPIVEQTGSPSADEWRHDVQLLLRQMVPGARIGPRVDHRVSADVTDLTASTTRTTAAVIGTPGRIGGRASFTVANMNVATLAIKLFPVYWDGLTVQEGAPVIDVSITADGDYTYEWEARCDGYRYQTATGAGTGGDNQVDVAHRFAFRDGDI